MARPKKYAPDQPRPCTRCKRMLPHWQYSYKKAVCKECIAALQKSKRRWDNQANYVSLFKAYENHPLISPLIYPHNPFFIEHFSFGCEHRVNPNHFVLFHMANHHSLQTAIDTFIKMYCWQYGAGYSAASDSALAEYFNPEIYTKERILQELYESNHHCFPTQPGKAYYRHNRHRIMIKTHRMFFEKICRNCKQLQPTYHINKTPRDDRPHWLKYLLDTIFLYKDLYPLPINFIPSFNYKDGWTATCNTCHGVPLSADSWHPHELDQGFTTKGRYIKVMQELGIRKKAMPKPITKLPKSLINQIINGPPPEVDETPQQDDYRQLVIPPEHEILRGLLYFDPNAQ